ncbi:hypothetical protein PR048_029272 [Dryococelus australis]|uniref:Uncharacterized protein n=1 Tax=Dryococelus australis TaxID=614101 RepID=A0ABQ9GFF7_9NEOP|nr:hypothetical protein PR048_029272 [Dryococelus australis]
MRLRLNITEPQARVDAIRITTCTPYIIVRRGPLPLRGNEQWYISHTTRLPLRRTGFDLRAGSHQFSQCGKHDGPCHWSAGFLWAFPFLPSLHSAAAPYSSRVTLTDAQDLQLTYSRSSHSWAANGCGFARAGYNHAIKDWHVTWGSPHPRVVTIKMKLACVHPPSRALGSPLIDDRPIMNAVKYRVVSGVVWTNRTMVSSHTVTNRTGVLAIANRVRFSAGPLPDFRIVGVVPDDAAGRRVFSGISRFLRPCILALLHTHLASSSSASKTWIVQNDTRRAFGAMLLVATQNRGEGENEREEGETDYKGLGDS